MHSQEINESQNQFTHVAKWSNVSGVMRGIKMYKEYRSTVVIKRGEKKAHFSTKSFFFCSQIFILLKLNS